MFLYTPICSLYTILFNIWGTIMGNFSGIVPGTTPTHHVGLYGSTFRCTPAEVAAETTLKYLNMISFPAAIVWGVNYTATRTMLAI